MTVLFGQSDRQTVQEVGTLQRLEWPDCWRKRKVMDQGCIWFEAWRMYSAGIGVSDRVVHLWDQIKSVPNYVSTLKTVL